MVQPGGPPPRREGRLPQDEIDRGGQILYIEDMLGLTRILIYALLFYIVYRILRFFNTIGRVKAPPKERQKLSGLMVKDEICNTYLPKEKALREIRQGKEHYFCSEECRKQFLQSQKK